MAQLAIAMCVISDLTSAGKSRSFFIAVFSFVYGFGSSLGTFLSGYVVTLFGHDYSMAVSSGLAVSSVVVTFFVPETLASSNKRQNHNTGKDHKKKFTCFGNCQEIMKFYTKDDTNNPDSLRWKFITAISAFIFIKIARLGAFSMEAYYLLGSPYCFSSEKISVFETVKEGFSEMFMLVGIKAMHKCFMDEGIALLSNISSIAQFILFGIGSKELYLDIGNSDEITLF